MECAPHAPSVDVVFMRPHTFECTIFKGLVACLSPLLEEQSCCLHAIHISQSNEDVEVRKFAKVHTIHHISKI